MGKEIKVVMMRNENNDQSRYKFTSSSTYTSWYWSITTFFYIYTPHTRVVTFVVYFLPGFTMRGQSNHVLSLCRKDIIRIRMSGRNEIKNIADTW